MSSSDDEPTFEVADAGSSHTYPMQAGSLRKGGHMMIKEKPCKVMDISTSKTGKHGHAKANITGIDIFTGKKYEDSCPTSHNVEVPNISRLEYQVLNVSDDGQISLLTDSGETKDDLDLPKDTDGKEDETAAQIRQMFNDGKSLLVTVVGACGVEKIMGVKELTA
jgi:translation initiation factor 5A